MECGPRRAMMSSGFSSPLPRLVAFGVCRQTNARGCCHACRSIAPRNTGNVQYISAARRGPSHARRHDPQARPHASTVSSSSSSSANPLVSRLRRPLVDDGPARRAGSEVSAADPRRAVGRSPRHARVAGAGRVVVVVMVMAVMVSRSSGRDDFLVVVVLRLWLAPETHGCRCLSFSLVPSEEGINCAGLRGVFYTDAPRACSPVAGS